VGLNAVFVYSKDNAMHVISLITGAIIKKITNISIEYSKFSKRPTIKEPKERSNTDNLIKSGLKKLKIFE
jgi:uncharacterized membrane protein YqgA involved in biofilm formation